jgi:solute carrier family 25 carnitine/acylcarnitine transporter 20/29
MGQTYLAGAAAGLANAPLSAPIEHVRIRLQTQPAGAARLYAGPWACARSLAARAGVAGGLYRGSAVTALREVQAYGVWFLTFEALMRADAKRNGRARKDVPTVLVAAYGGVAGEALWVASYPLDVVKSRMQTDGFGEERRFRTMRAAFRETWREGGAGAFWRGIGPTLVRAMPVSAGTFAV